MRKLLFFGVIVLAAGGGAFSFMVPREVPLMNQEEAEGRTVFERFFEEEEPVEVAEKEEEVLSNGDILPQAPLPDPPEEAKGIYLTGWSAGTPSRVEAAIALAKRTEINAVVVDIKDYSGYISYHVDIPEVKAVRADREIRILHPNAMIKRFHDEGIYVIARLTVFQDPILAAAHPEWAVQSKANGGLWKDRKGIAWMDTAAKPVWDYNIAIAKDALDRGFDEVNFDYIRFPSDGVMADASYPFWGESRPRREVLRDFFAYLRSELPEAKISADLFGLVTVNPDDLGIGQVIEDAYPYFDYICPMVYPSHYADGFIGYENPAAHPYGVIKYSLDKAFDRRVAMASSSVPAAASLAKLRPWIQDFNLGATYTSEMVRAQIQATYDSLLKPGGEDSYGGWLLWDPSNTYTESALQKAAEGQ